MRRRLNSESEAEIKVSEACKLVGYLDSGGVPTIGWGHTGSVNGKPVRVGMKITQAVAQQLFEQDTGIAGDAVLQAVHVDLDDYQYGALTSWTLNVGVQAMRNSTLVKKLNNGDYDSVPREFMKWVNDNGRRVPGLVNRRSRDAALWARGGEHRPLGVISSTAQKAPPNLSMRDLATIGGMGTAGVAAGAPDGSTTLSRIADAVTMQQYDLTSGDWLRIGIAVAILGMSIYGIYRYKQNQ